MPAEQALYDEMVRQLEVLFRWATVLVLPEAAELAGDCDGLPVQIARSAHERTAALQVVLREQVHAS